MVVHRSPMRDPRAVTSNSLHTVLFPSGFCTQETSQTRTGFGEADLFRTRARVGARRLGFRCRPDGFGLFTACAVMCRSVLEEAIKQKLSPALTRLVRTRYRNAATLGNLLHEVNNNLQLTGIDPDFPRLANQVNDTGKKAVHQGLLCEDEARGCLQNAREALRLLLKR